MVSLGHCLMVLLFRGDRFALEPLRDVRYWVLTITLLMAAISTLDGELGILIRV